MVIPYEFALAICSCLVWSYNYGKMVAKYGSGLA